MSLIMFALNALRFLALQSVLVSAQYQVPLGGEHGSPFSYSFDELVSHNLDYWHVPGISIAVVDGNETYSKVCTIFSNHEPN